MIGNDCLEQLCNGSRLICHALRDQLEKRDKSTKQIDPIFYSDLYTAAMKALGI